MAYLDDIIARRVEDALQRELRREAEDIGGRSVRDAPIDEGTLRGSMEIEMREIPGGAEAEISFNTPYAARQHEEMEWEHPRGGKAKYLEDNVKGFAQFHADNLGRAMGRALRG